MHSFNSEPSIEDILSDPVTRLVMARDGLTDDIMRAVIAEARRRLKGAALLFVGDAAVETATA
jgi:hypothetical protein